MGKLLCDASSTAVAPAADPLPPPSSPAPPSPSPSTHLLTWPSPSPSPSTWSTVWSLDDQQRRRLLQIHDRGVAWKPPTSLSLSPDPVLILRLDHGGEVDSDGNCLFTAVRTAASAKATPRELRHRSVRRFQSVYAEAQAADRDAVDAAVRHLYAPDLGTGWGVHVVQEVKMLARKDQRQGMDGAIKELVDIGIQRETAAETIYKERCIAVNDGDSWAKYMSISGSAEDEHDIITLQYTEEGLLTVDENRDGRAAAFGDDIAIECLATDFKREVFVVQAHGADAMVDEENCVFFLPHRPRGEICDTPIFLFMKGTGVLPVHCLSVVSLLQVNTVVWRWCGPLRAPGRHRPRGHHCRQGGRRALILSRHIVVVVVLVVGECSRANFVTGGRS